MIHDEHGPVQPVQTTLVLIDYAVFPPVTKYFNYDANPSERL